MESFRQRFQGVPWCKRLLTAAVVIPPLLYMLKNPVTARILIYLVGIVAIRENLKMRIGVLSSLYANIIKDITKVATTKAASSSICKSTKLEKDENDEKEEYDENEEKEKKSLKTNETGKDCPENEHDKPLLCASALPLIVCWTVLMVFCIFDDSNIPKMPFITITIVGAFFINAYYCIEYAWSTKFAKNPSLLVYVWCASSLDVLFMMFYLLPLATGGYVIASPNGFPLSIILLSISFLADCGALFFGSTCGKTFIISRLSPKKSAEGLAGAFIWAYSTGAVLHLLSLFVPLLNLPRIGLMVYFLIATLVCIFGFIGDFVESAYKRAAGVKDSSQLFGAHGGMLDRLDSLLPPIPVLTLVAMYLEII